MIALLRALRGWRAGRTGPHAQIEFEQSLIDNCPYLCDNGEIYYIDGFGGVSSTPCNHGYYKEDT